MSADGTTAIGNIGSGNALPVLVDAEGFEPLRDLNTEVAISNLLVHRSLQLNQRIDRVADACSHSAVRPIRRIANDDVGLAGHFIGRPWNTCDWRGLLAIFPNASRGDGWFERVHQWIRLMHVRHFGGADYGCEEPRPPLPQEPARSAAKCANASPSQRPYTSLLDPLANE